MSDLQKIKEQVSIRDVAESLLHLEKQDGKYKYPGERTASIQLYTDTQSFNDFGRNVGGDIFKLVSHIEGITRTEVFALMFRYPGFGFLRLGSTQRNSGSRWESD